MIIHHPPLESHARRPRGHSSLWGAADTVLLLNERSGILDLSVLKQKDLDQAPGMCFVLRTVDLGIDENGEPITSCVLELANIAEKAVKRGLAGDRRVVLEALQEALLDEGIDPPVDIPATVLPEGTSCLVLLSDWRSTALAKLQRADRKPDSSAKSFNRAVDWLSKRKLVGTWDKYAWLVVVSRGYGHPPDIRRTHYRTATLIGQTGQGS